MLRPLIFLTSIVDLSTTRQITAYFYLIAIDIHSRKLITAILVIPTRPPDKAPSAAPNLLFGSLNGVTYFPAGVTSAVLFSKCSRGIRTWLKDTNLKSNKHVNISYSDIGRFK